MDGVPEVQAEEETFTGARGLRIHARTWLPADPPTGVVVIAHGFAEHGGRYAAVAARLVADGIAVMAPDHRGHGLSQGKRTAIVRFDDYIDDLTTVIAQARARWRSLALVLLGHSMGGLIALGLAVRPGAPLDGLVLSAPAACPREVSRFTLAIGRGLARVAPNTGVLRLPLNRISRDPAEMLETMARVDTALPALRLPLLVMQGTADGLVDPGCGPHVYDRAGSGDKTLKMYDGLWHEIFNEPEREHVLSDLIGWLRLHLG